METNEGHISDRTRSLFDRTRPVSAQCLCASRSCDRRGDASGHDQSDASGHAWRLSGNDRTLALWLPVRLERSVRLTCASGR
jgi:hypothetical protein